MKRCIVCGNVDDDNSTVCSVCGNPYVDMGEGVSGAEGAPAGQPEASQEPVSGQPEAVQEAVSEQRKAAQRVVSGQPETVQEAASAQSDMLREEASGQPNTLRGGASEQPNTLREGASEQPKAVRKVVPEQQDWAEAGPQEPVRKGAANAPQENNVRQYRGENPRMQGQTPAGNRPQRRMRSGPQIYGQTEGMNDGQELYANQGMVRRTVPPRNGQMAGNRPGGQASGDPRRSSGQMQGGAARQVGRAQEGRPGNQMSGGAGRQSGADFQARRVRETARKSLKSPLFILIVVLNTVFVLSSIAAIFLNELNYSQIVRLANDADLPQQMSGYVGTMTTLLQRLDSGHMILPNIMLHVPQILFCLGLWLIMITAFAAKDEMSGVGFGFAKAAVIIRMVAACAIMFITLIVTVTVVIAAWASGQRPIIIMSIVMLVIAVVIVMMIIMYYFSYLATLKTCRMNSNMGESYGKLSAYVAVLHIILGLTGIVGLLSGIVNVEISGIVGSAAKIGWMLLFAVWIFHYRGKMSELGE